MLEFIIPIAIVALSASTLFIRPIREAFDDMVRTTFEGPRRFVWGLMYIYVGRKNPELEEYKIDMRIEQSERDRAARERVFRQVKLAADHALEAKSLARVTEIREWQEEFIRLEDPELYAKHIAPYKRHEMNVLNYPEVWELGPGRVVELTPGMQVEFDGETARLYEPARARLEVSERRFNTTTKRWGHYWRYTDGSEQWAYES